MGGRNSTNTVERLPSRPQKHPQCGATPLLNDPARRPELRTASHLCNANPGRYEPVETMTPDTTSSGASAPLPLRPIFRRKAGGSYGAAPSHRADVAAALGVAWLSCWERCGGSVLLCLQKRGVDRGTRLRAGRSPGRASFETSRRHGRCRLGNLGDTCWHWRRRKPPGRPEPGGVVLSTATSSHMHIGTPGTKSERNSERASLRTLGRRSLPAWAHLEGG